MSTIKQKSGLGPGAACSKEVCLATRLGTDEERDVPRRASSQNVYGLRKWLALFVTTETHQ